MIAGRESIFFAVHGRPRGANADGSSCGSPISAPGSPARHVPQAGVRGVSGRKRSLTPMCTATEYPVADHAALDLRLSARQSATHRWSGARRLTMIRAATAPARHRRRQRRYATDPVKSVFLQGFPARWQPALLLDGYGSYGIPNPSFRPQRVRLGRSRLRHRRCPRPRRRWASFAQKVARRRRLSNKKNAFTDFARCHRFHLIHQRYIVPRPAGGARRLGGGAAHRAVANMRSGSVQGKSLAHMFRLSMISIDAG